MKKRIKSVKELLDNEEIDKRINIKDKEIIIKDSIIKKIEQTRNVKDDEYCVNCEHLAISYHKNILEHHKNLCVSHSYNKIIVTLTKSINLYGCDFFSKKQSK
jgi:hypothetical protein